MNGFIKGFVSALAAIATILLLIEYTPLPDRLVAPLVREDTNGPGGAIVVLGAGLIGNCEPNAYALRRTLLAVQLWRAGRAHAVLFTGGAPQHQTCAIADVMAGLARDLGVPSAAIRVERTSRSTHENALFASPLLQQMGISRIVVVTDRLHMSRAAAAFAHFGFDIERASVPVYASHGSNIGMLTAASRESAALTWYWWKGWLEPAAIPLQKAAEARLAEPLSRDAMMDQESRHNREIVLLGASYAAGWHLGDVSGRKIVNKGIQGQQSFEVLQRFDRDVIALRPEAVIIWGFINDVFRTPADEVEKALVRTRATYEQMIAKARANGIKPILATEVTLSAGDGSWRETLASWAGSILGKASYQARINGHVLRVNEWICEVSRRDGLLLLDLRAALSDASNQRRREFAKEDGSHITPAGYAALTSYAKPLLERHFASRP